MEYFILICFCCFLLGIVLSTLYHLAPSKFKGYLHVVKYEDTYNLLLQVTEDPSNFKDGQMIKVRVVRK